MKPKFWRFRTNLTLKIKVKVTSFQIGRDLYVINTWFKFEGKIKNASKVIAFTRNHTDDDDGADDDDEEGTKNNMSPPDPGET